ncbi:MAG: hypothetical protein ACLFNL_00350 [Bacteroidales bacterium]
MVKLQFFLLSILCSMFLAGQLCYAQTNEELEEFRQDTGKQEFEKIMERETSSLQDNPSDLFLYFLIPERLPDWFFRPSSYASTNDFMIGVSDPGMDSAKALENAIFRAKALYCLSEETLVENVSDNFVINREKGKPVLSSQYMEFTKIRAKKGFNDKNFVVDKKLYTKYGECIVLISLNSKPIAQKEDTLAVTAELMELVQENSFNMNNNTFFSRMNAYLNTDSKGGLKTTNMSYMYQDKRGGYDMISVFNNDTIYLPVRPYRYLSFVDLFPENNTEGSTGFSSSVNRGLWNAYINLVLKHLNYHNNYLQSTVKRSFDNYTSSNQGMVRMVSRNSFSFKLKNITLDKQRLDLKLNFGN